MNTTKGMTAQDYARGCLLRITNDPDSYDQSTWQTVATEDVNFTDGEGQSTAEVSCQTTGCVAGTASMLAGDLGIVTADEPHMIVKHKAVYPIYDVITKAGEVLGIKERGAKLLELGNYDAEWLFESYRTLPEVINALIELSEGKALTQREASDMSRDEIDRLTKYKVTPKVTRKLVAKKAPAKAATKKVTVH